MKDLIFGVLTSVGILVALNMIFDDSPEPDPLEICLRDWPLAECQARKDAGVMP